MSRNEKNNEKYITVNKSLKLFKKRWKSFYKKNKIKNRINVDSNSNKENDKNNNDINQDKNVSINNIFKNNSSLKINVNRNIFNKNESINVNCMQNTKYDKYIDKKNKLKKYFDKLSDTKHSTQSTYLKLKKGNKLNQFKKEQDINKLITIEEHLITE